MATASTLGEVLSVIRLQDIFESTQKDDVALLAFLVITGLFYSFFIKEKTDPYHHLWFEKPQSTDGNAKEADTRDIGVKLEESASTIAPTPTAH